MSSAGIRRWYTPCEIEGGGGWGGGGGVGCRLCKAGVDEKVRTHPGQGWAEIKRGKTSNSDGTREDSFHKKSTGWEAEQREAI